MDKYNLSKSKFDLHGKVVLNEVTQPAYQDEPKSCVWLPQQKMKAQRNIW